jgi:hypothetical protein
MKPDLSILCAVLVLAFPLASCSGVSYHGYQRGVPTKIDIERAPAEPQVIARAKRTIGTEVDVRVLAFHEVNVKRSVHYGALEFTGSHPGHPLWEPLEWLLSPFLAFYPRSSVGFQTADSKMGWTHNLGLIAISPFHTVMGVHYSVKVADGEPFPARTSLRRHNMYLPVADLSLRYRVLDDAHTELAAGSVLTDVHGVVTIPVVPIRAVGIEFIAEGVAIVVPIEGTAKPPPPPDELPTKVREPTETEGL